MIRDNRGPKSMRAFVVAIVPNGGTLRKLNRIMGHSEVAVAAFQMREDAERHLKRWAENQPDLELFEVEITVKRRCRTRTLAR